MLANVKNVMSQFASNRLDYLSDLTYTHFLGINCRYSYNLLEIKLNIKINWQAAAFKPKLAAA